MGDEGTPFGLDALSVFDMPWPRCTDTLRPSRSVDGSHLELRSTRGGDYERVEGYRLAAMTLADTLDRGESSVESLVYPFVYCWRHHIELQLKMLIRDSAKLYDDPLPNWLNRTHSIAKLWRIAAGYIAESFPNDASADTQIPARIVGQLAQIDPDGMALRYARTAAGGPTFSNPVWVELLPFHTAMRNLSAYVQGAIDGTSWLAENL